MARADVTFPRTKISDPNALKQTRIIQPGTAANAFKGVVQQPRQPFEKQQVYKTSRILGIRRGPAYVASASGTITLSGTATDSFAVKPPAVYYPKAVDVLQVFRGSRLIASIAVAAPIVYTDSASGTITLSGTSSESFSPPAAVV